MSEIETELQKKRNPISTLKYVMYVVIMTINWTAVSFSFYLLLFMNKYTEGSIFLNFYLEGCAGVLGSLLSLLTYGYLRMRWSFIISVSYTLVGAIFILVFQQGYLSPHWVNVFVAEKSPYEEDSPEDREYYLGYLIPGIVFITKIGINQSFMNVYQASFGDTLIFPFYKRATAVGICNVVARSTTILSSLVAELDRPIPAIILISLTGLQFIANIFLPSKSEEDEYFEKVQEAKEKTN